MTNSEELFSILLFIIGGTLFFKKFDPKIRKIIGKYLKIKIGVRSVKGAWKSENIRNPKEKIMSDIVLSFIQGIIVLLVGIFLIFLGLFISKLVGL